MWRRGRDSNPRQGSTLNTLSRRAISTTHPPLRGKLRIVAECGCQEIPLEPSELCNRKRIESCRSCVAFEAACKGLIAGLISEGFCVRRKMRAQSPANGEYAFSRAWRRKAALIPTDKAVKQASFVLQRVNVYSSGACSLASFRRVRKVPGRAKAPERRWQMNAL